VECEVEAALHLVQAELKSVFLGRHCPLSTRRSTESKSTLALPARVRLEYGVGLDVGANEAPLEVNQSSVNNNCLGRESFGDGGG
jgi:hypothetical protein